MIVSFEFLDFRDSLVNVMQTGSLGHRTIIKQKSTFVNVCKMSSVASILISIILDTIIISNSNREAYYCMFFRLFAKKVLCGQLHSLGGTRIICFINGRRETQLQGVESACKQLN